MQTTLIGLTRQWICHTVYMVGTLLQEMRERERERDGENAQRYCVGVGGLVSVWDVSKAKSQCFVVREPLYYNKLNSQECS